MDWSQVHLISSLSPPFQFHHLVLMLLLKFLQNKKNLLGYLKKIVDNILNSIEDCPTPLREVFAHMQSEVVRKSDSLSQLTPRHP